ncbi:MULTISPECIES: 2-hydroxychromene-2-carboxylate isomerase [unclassified Hyphomonas]|uniref:2-hydroxychromene-2-carboxylate isomerase n=1 Tax=unclassified Hyphomonas TaxID=2630699 RepID=UPI000C9659FD|nr:MULTISPECIES: 2-hydroxychromene-2-carboxylate isomerase [unclassified Hyphomonas]MAL45425.1 disulfide bond formation protein DsbA [Hyphomonas sp.]HAO35732.1 disulfide bond formation protein DsbA [Hyphomonas sp.]HBJ39417.1 disulfide bond formation protein DsbA [Hyphomonas sp.]HBT35438.1 disulfide bond formation protein DsbA [Hyphomonas sp.]HBX93811.1 disulfide bond formation protein DsbA [Hyphomonas sp.]
MRDVSVEFHFDFGSPNAYLSHKVIPDVEARTGVSFTYVPVLLGGVFKATGNQSPVMAFAGIRNKPEYERLEMMRFIERHGLTQAFAMNPHFPVNTLAIMRGAVAAQHLDVFKPYVNAIYAAMWQGAQKMDDPETIGRVLTAADLPADALMATAQDSGIKQELVDNTTASVERGNFGSPTFFVKERMWFGKDRLRDVEEAILAARAA